jgi:transposase
MENQVILGVDTHLDCHVGAVLTNARRLLSTLSVSCDATGYSKLIFWARSFGTLGKAGVEGTGTYGAALTKVLREEGVEVFEVNRPDRTKRRLKGKSDTTDAESAARSVLSGNATAIPKTHCGLAEALRTITVARRSAVKAKTQAINQLRSILVSAPQEIRERLWKKEPADVVEGCLKIRTFGTSLTLVSLALTLRALAKRWEVLAAEMKVLDSALESMTAKHAKRLRQRFGIGPYTAATLIAVAGDNPERLKSEAAMAALCGASPLEASSGKTQRHRLNRGGDRTANNAL